MRQLCALTLVLLLGCGSAVSDVDPNLVPAGGTVTIDGKPVPNGTVYFVAEAEDGKDASATIEGGSFTVKMSPSAPGILPGNYKVAIVAKDGIDTMDAEGNPVPAKNLAPESYGDVKTSGLTASVPAGGKTDLVFELKSKP